MNKLAVVCLLVACAVTCQAIVRTSYPGSIRYCRDYTGRLIRPGQSYYIGCNTCTCGINGRPSFCTQRYCGDDIYGSGGLGGVGIHGGVGALGGVGVHGGHGALGGVGVHGGHGGLGAIGGIRRVGHVGGIVNHIGY